MILERGVAGARSHLRAVHQRQAEGVETKQALEATIGAPDEVDKLGPVERWTYRASDGDVEFVITGDDVGSKRTKDRDDDEEAESE